jgi:F-type H+-transporting ATPase subunit gamma
VAEIAWRRAEQRFEPLRQYRTQVQTVFERVVSSLAREQREAVLGLSKEQRPLAVLFVTSERGLCGPFTDRVVMQGLQHVRTLSAQGQTVVVLCLGSRGRRLLEGAGHTLLYTKPLPSLSVPTYVDIEGVALDLLDLTEKKAFGHLAVVHNAPVGRFQYGMVVQHLLPPDLTVPPRPPKRSEVKPLRDTPHLVTHLLTEHLLLGLYQTVIESAMSEQLARVSAMRLATENARHLLENLTVAYNAARAHAVTNSLLEIVAGYEATMNSGAIKT